MGTTETIPRSTPTPDTPDSLQNGNLPQKMPDDNTVTTNRGPVIENTHRIHVAITNAAGFLLYSTGDSSRLVLARSAAKPIQSLAILETGAAENYGFSDADIALMSASHNSEPQHVLRAQEMLGKTGAQESDLTCGGHPSISPATNRIWMKEGFIPSKINNNCSGKHAGMIAGGIALGASVQGYEMPHHPMQQKVKKCVEEVSGLSSSDVLWAVDGCNLPAPALPLRNMALMYARLAEACDLDGAHGDERKGHLARIHRSMSTYPELVGGEGRFCTDLMRAYEGLLVGKVGADACYGVSVKAGEYGSEHGAIGIAVKVEDGNLDVLYSAVPEILEQLGIGTPSMREKLEGWRFPKITNTAGVVTGGFKHNFTVGKVAEK